MDRKQSKQKIEKLVQTFHREVHEKINEAETRLRFIDPFFEALGWDIRDPREVRVESALARSEATRPDYRFLIDGKTKFFAEAKKPAVKLTDPAPIFQAKSYGFSSKVPIVILTDFEEFRPFRTLARPKFDKPLDGLIKEFDYTYERYVDEFDTLYNIFSREAVAAGEMEKRIPTAKKEASQTVDKEFLNDLSKWQEELAKNIALRNPKLTVGEINEAVQRILDRIIFLRICEDRQIEESEILLSYADSEDVYQKLQKEFTRLRSKYNGLIFNEHRLSEQLSIDDKLLKEIIKNLYLPHSPYRFNEIPIEILGTIYEQYLGKVITLTPSHRAKVEVKPEVRKAGGVFYTPQFITSYIVKNTIGRLLQPSEGSRQESGGQAKPSEGLTPDQIAKLKFADIACGSGSFLLEMFDYLIRYHIDYYSANTSKVKTVDGVPDAYQTSDGLWHLSTRKKKEILTNNIYGVDIDPQAVEVTQMSLYLKLLEGESAETFGKQLALELKETILPSLSNNIKCGNSLVGMDIKGLGQNLTLEEEVRIRPFDWETAFPEILGKESPLLLGEGQGEVLHNETPSQPSPKRGRSIGGGFDAIVGNPPYGMLQPHNTSTELLSYFQNHFFAADFKIDMFHLFMQRGLTLLKEDGMLGYIVPTTILNNVYVESLRKWIMDHALVNSIVVCREKVFPTADVHTSVLIFTRESDHRKRESNLIKTSISSIKEFNQNTINFSHTLQHRFSELPGKVWNVLLNENNGQLIKRLTENYKKLADIASINRGLITGDRDKYFSKTKKTNKHVPIIAGSDVERYYTNPPTEFVLFDRPKTSGGCWDKEVHFAPHKIVIRQIGFAPTASILTQPIAVTGNVFTIMTKVLRDELYILGIINSRLIKYYWGVMFTDFKTSFPQVTIFSLSQLPIRTIDFNNRDEKAMHDRMVELVERMLDLHKKNHQAKADSEKELFEHQIKATDREIDELVYGLYRLNADESKAVEKQQ